MAQFLNDTFTDTDSTLLVSHTGETGATWTLHSVNSSGSAIIGSNRLRGNTGGAQGSFFYSSGTPAGADYYVEGTLSVQTLLAGSYTGVLGRVATGASTFYWAIYNVASGQFELWKTVTGTATTLGTWANTPSGSPVLRLDMVGTTIRVLVNGTERISVTDSSITAAGRAGVVFYASMGASTGVHIDTVTASDAVTALAEGTASVTATGLTTVSVSTTAPTGGTSPYTYQWHRSTTSGFTPGVGTTISGATSLTLNDTGLTRGTTYYYKCVQTDSAAASVTTAQVSTTTRVSQIVCDGDSITAGTGLSAGQDYPSQMQSILGSTWQINNVAVSGQTCAQMQSTRTDVDALYSSSNTNNVAVCFGGTNDIYFNADADDTAVTTYGRIVTFCQACQTAGFKVVVCTLLPRNDFPGTSTLPSVQQTKHETRRLAVNAAIRANWRSFADSLADIALDARLGDNGDYDDTTYYQSDKVHPTSTGAQKIAERVSTAVATAINAGGTTGTGSIAASSPIAFSFLGAF